MDNATVERVCCGVQHDDDRYDVPAYELGKNCVNAEIDDGDYNSDCEERGHIYYSLINNTYAIATS